MSIPWINKEVNKTAVANGWKTHSNPFMGLGMTRTFAFMGAVGMVTSGFSAGGQFLDDAWNEDPNKFQRAGYAMGGMVGEGLAVATTAYAGWDMWRRVGAQDMARVGGKAGPLYNIEKSGGLKLAAGSNAGGFKPSYSAAEASQLKNVVHGQNANSMRFRSGGKFKTPLSRGFTGNMGMAMNLGAMIALPIVAGMAASATLGMAGKVLDTVRNESIKGMGLNYDKRYFNTEQYDMSSYQQLGAAMQQQESRAMSVARIYHG